jgi:alpha,alpha-trehalose phosphorylase
MIQHPAFPIEPWAVRETHLDLERLPQLESVFALSNGHLGLRGNLDEGEPFGLPGTYLAGFYETRPLPYAESGYGYPEAGQSVVNVTNGKIMRLLVEDEPLDVRYGTLERHERVLDLRAGVLRRTVEWRSPTDRRVRVTSTRLVSLTQRAVAAILYEVEPLDGRMPVVLQSELVANEPSPVIHDDPRAAAALAAPLVSESFDSTEQRAVLVHRTRASGLRIAAAMDHVVEGPAGTEVENESFADLARVIVTTDLEPGQTLRVVKFLGYGWSAERSVPALRDQVSAALRSAKHSGWQGLVDEQQATLDDVWTRADVEIEGDSELQQAVRFAMFHTLQAGFRGEQRAIAAKGLTGPGYDGHAFWDTECFVLPILTYTLPNAAADALRWRHATLPMARERAKQLGLPGAAFPWRTIAGEECSSYWPAGTAAFHVNADIAYAVDQYQMATRDEAFEKEVGMELLVETARLWRGLGHHDGKGRFRIDGVTGPDEYSAIADNNVYTNLMAARNLRAAAEMVARHPDRAGQLSVDEEEAAGWRDAAAAMMVPFDSELGVHCQSEGFTSHQVWDFASTSPDQYPLLLHYPYFDLYRKQVVKQADLTLAMQLCGEAFTAEEKLHNFDYYERLTVRDSSLSACSQAVMAAEVGHLDLAYDYLGEAALMDLDDLEHNTRDGVHIASLAGSVVGTLMGFGGVRINNGELLFAPRLPGPMTRLKFHIVYCLRNLRVEVTQRHSVYTLEEGDPLDITHHGRRLTLTTDKPRTESIPRMPLIDPPTQPPGRAPARRRPQR